MSISVISGVTEFFRDPPGSAKSTAKSVRGPQLKLSPATIGTLLCALGLLGLSATGCKTEKIAPVDMSVTPGMEDLLDPTATCENTKCEDPTAQCCNGEPCVDVKSNALNCGSCGKTCAVLEQCMNGSCNCGGGGHVGACAAGDRCCADGCHGTMSDVKNCGGCGVACKTAESCLSGKCSCGPAGAACTGSQACCSTGCADFQTDAKNCGSCGHACAAGHACTAGVCEGECIPCGLGETCCNGVCANLNNDPNNCKTCGHKCAFPGCTIGICWFSNPDAGADMSSHD